MQFRDRRGLKAAGACRIGPEGGMPYEADDADDLEPDDEGGEV